MKIGVISDTHDNLNSATKAFWVFGQKRVKIIIHCGDWSSPEVAEGIKKEAEKIEAEIVGVIGNNDNYLLDIMLDEKNKGRFNFISMRVPLVLKIDNKKIAVIHGDVKPSLEETIKSGAYDAVFTGHTHRAKIEKSNNTLIINPGSASFLMVRAPGSGPSVAIYDTENNQAEIIFIK